MTTCEEIRERLAESMLGTLEEKDELAVRQHLRGCAGCRKEAAALGEGLATFSRAAHDMTPPPELKDRVASVLHQEWQDVPVIGRRPHPRVWLAAAAALIVVASLTWGLAQNRQASVAAANSSSYLNLLHVLGGKQFRVGTLQPAPGKTAEGSVVVYESSHDQSWVLVFVRAPGLVGSVTATLKAKDGRSIDLWPMTLAADGAGSTYLVTATDLAPFDTLTVTAPDSSPLATAQIVAA